MKNYKKLILSGLNDTGWELLESEGGSEWWLDEFWKIRSLRQRWGYELFILFLIDPEDSYLEKRGRKVYSIEVFEQLPDTRPLNGDGLIAMDLRKGKFDTKLAKFISDLDEFRNSSGASAFNEDFCQQLEFHLCRTFEYSTENSTQENLSGFWCDGISWAPFVDPADNRTALSNTRIQTDKCIVTTAYLGKTGQDVYEMTLRLGKRSLSNYDQGLSLIDCLPDENSMDWISLDLENRKIELRLL